MLMAEQEPYVLMVQPDDITINPRELDEPFGKMVCFHRQYSLGDSHEYADHNDFLQDLYLKTVGDDEKGVQKYERLLERISRQKETPYGSYAYSQAVNQALMKKIREKHIVLPLYLLDHSGLAMKTTSFHDPWDSGQAGWIYVSKEAALKEFGSGKMTAQVQEKAEALMRSEVAVYDSYLRGECYGFELYKNGELEDSCWGFIGDMKTVCKNIADYLPDECRGMVKELEEQERPASIVKMLLRHAKIQVEQAAKDMERSPRQQVLGETR